MSHMKTCTSHEHGLYVMSLQSADSQAEHSVEYTQNYVIQIHF